MEEQVTRQVIRLDSPDLAVFNSRARDVTKAPIRF